MLIHMTIFQEVEFYTSYLFNALTMESFHHVVHKIYSGNAVIGAH